VQVAPEPDRVAQQVPGLFPQLIDSHAAEW
jgi:hypothetical protein